MSYQEKRTITSTVSGIVMLIAYSIFAISKYNSDDTNFDLKDWATTMLIFIGIGIVAIIIIQIVFHILLSISIAIREHERDDKEIEKRIKAEIVEDERDNIIEMKAARISFMLTGIGFMISLFLVVFNYSAITMLNTIFFSFLIGSILEGFIQIYYYRKS
ncbi:MAG: hypothetical protein US52_C0024G0007 [candidate division WS6 bacterium GW2011_GWA2_37_6]|uniref:Uncharacterized protein n=1 Tax=candidate division WS6 bacterium GW2011_GWA2_37_6 TaxID=1619087 RepID=A0A0G0GWU8_9BACT|nr:MAG: hypothetical protein US52_C0024G0007 [candidate division WS6 bacterium GW2011_GWA2_37_6]